MLAHAQEVAANLERAGAPIRAATELFAKGFYDFAASRAYYAAFYAATSALLSADLGSGKHTGIIALVHRYLVRTGKLSEENGRSLNWLFELRGIRDYGVLAHVPREESERAIQAAKGFVAAVEALLGKGKEYPEGSEHGETVT